MTINADKALDVIAAVKVAGGTLAVATARQLTLARFLSVKKDEAVRRLVASRNLSGTAAERIVEGDPEFAAACREVIQAEVDRLNAVSAYDVAKLAARLAVALIEARRYEDMP